MLALVLATSVTVYGWMVPCSVVREYVEKYGREGAEQMARSYWPWVVVTDSVRRKAEVCLAKKEKN